MNPEINNKEEIMEEQFFLPDHCLFNINSLFLFLDDIVSYGKSMEYQINL